MKKIITCLLSVLIVFVFSGCGLIPINSSVFELVGESEINLEVYEEYYEQGAIALDKDGNEIEYTISGSVNMDVLGSYTITYSIDS